MRHGTAYASTQNGVAPPIRPARPEAGGPAIGDDWAVDLGLNGKACVVTGASRGIGLATTRLLEAEGASVLAVSRSGDGLAADVTDPDAAEQIAGECERRFGRFDVLVNNAGTSQAKPVDELTDADWQVQWELHVMAPMRLMRAAGERMGEGGRIVNVCSSSGKRPSLTLDAAYSVTKAAQLSLSRVVADAYAGTGVLVNAVNPGRVRTRMMPAQQTPPDVAARFIADVATLPDDGPTGQFLTERRGPARSGPPNRRRHAI